MNEHRFLRFRNAGDSGGAPIVPPAAPPAMPPAAEPPAGSENDASKYRRLFEAEETRRKALETEAAALREADKKRRDAELSDLEREKQARLDAEERAKQAELKSLRQSIAAEHKIDGEARDFLTGEDETTLRAQAEKLAKMTAATAAAHKPPAAGGTITNPPAGQQPSVAERVAAARKAGNPVEAIRLMREEKFGAG